MTFTYEPLSDHDFKEIVRRKPNASYLAGKPSHWVVDSLNNVQLLSLGGQGDMAEGLDLPSDYFLLIWKNQILQFQSRQKTSVTADGKVMSQKAFNLFVPKILKEEAVAIAEALADALNVYWRALPTAQSIKSIDFSLAPISFI